MAGTLRMLQAGVVVPQQIFGPPQQQHPAHGRHLQRRLPLPQAVYLHSLNKKPTSELLGCQDCLGADRCRM